MLYFIITKNKEQRMHKIIIVGIGGFFGAIARYLISGWTNQLYQFKGFPLGTLFVNILGCLTLGILIGLAEYKHIITPQIKIFIMIGLLGSLTTFSTFGLETYNLLKNSEFFILLFTIVIHLIGGLIAIWAGQSFAKLF